MRGPSIRLFLFLPLAALLGCAAPAGKYSFTKLEGREVGFLAYATKEELAEKLRTSGGDETDVAVESKMIPNGGVLSLQDKINSSFDPIVGFRIEDGTEPIECDESDVDVTDYATGGLSRPTIRVHKSKTVIDCKVKRKLKFPARLTFIGVRGDTVSRYSLQPSGSR